MIDNNFLRNRNHVADELKLSNLWKIVDHFSLYAGIQTIGNKLFIYEIFKESVGIPGDIVEFGCHNGANLLFLAKLKELLERNSPKIVYGFDNFSGLPTATSEDAKYALDQRGKYKGNLDSLIKIIELFDFTDSVKLVIGDEETTINDFYVQNNQVNFSFAYIDFDLYLPTKEALKLLEKTLNVGGWIIFDQANTPHWPGETRAMMEFLDNSRHKFKMVSNTISVQPTIALQRTD